MVRLKKMQYFLILIFPLFIILSATLLKGDGMNTISFLYTVIIWWLIIINHKNRIKMFDLFYLFFGIWLVLFSVLRETSATYYFGIQFANLIVAFILFSDRYFSINAFGLYCLKKQKIFKIVNIGIYALLMYSFLVNGLYYTKLWATGVFRGPFNLPHTLAYILFFITLLDLYYYDKLKGIIYLIFAGINTVLILSTAVRSVLLPLAFAFLYFILKIYRGNSNIKKLIISVTIIAGAIIIFWSGIALPVIEKSRFAFERGGDITNSRGKIFISSMKAIFDNKYDAEFNPVMGIGMSGLFEYNLKTLHFAMGL